MAIMSEGAWMVDSAIRNAVGWQGCDQSGGTSGGDTAEAEGAGREFHAIGVVPVASDGNGIGVSGER